MPLLLQINNIGPDFYREGKGRKELGFLLVSGSNVFMDRFLTNGPKVYWVKR